MKVVISELNWPVGIDLLRQQGWNVVYDPELWKHRDRLARELEDAHALIVRNQTKVNADLLQTAGKLKVIGRLGVGLDNLDFSLCADRSLTVVYAKNANATSVAEYVIAALFSSVRLLREASEDVGNGNWNRKKYTGDELFGQTLGLIGIGEIGHRVAVRARAIGVHVVGFDPYVAPYDFPLMESEIQPVAFQELLHRSDFISLHVPLTDQTRNLLDAATFREMKPTACVINTSRGGIINEEDLAQALRDHAISSAILDVLSQEPPPADHPLLRMDNCMITPHIAGLTEPAQIRTARLVSEEVIRELSGGISLCRVPTRRQADHV